MAAHGSRQTLSSGSPILTKGVAGFGEHFLHFQTSVQEECTSNPMSGESYIATVPDWFLI